MEQRRVSLGAAINEVVSKSWQALSWRWLAKTGSCPASQAAHPGLENNVNENCPHDERRVLATRDRRLALRSLWLR